MKVVQIDCKCGCGDELCPRHQMKRAMVMFVPETLEDEDRLNAVVEDSKAHVVKHVDVPDPGLYIAFVSHMIEVVRDLASVSKDATIAKNGSAKDRVGVLKKMLTELGMNPNEMKIIQVIEQAVNKMESSTTPTSMTEEEIDKYLKHIPGPQTLN